MGSARLFTGVHAGRVRLHAGVHAGIGYLQACK